MVVITLLMYIIGRLVYAVQRHQGLLEEVIIMPSFPSTDLTTPLRLTTPKHPLTAFFCSSECSWSQHSARYWVLLRQ